jgi:hypothetical protein
MQNGGPFRSRAGVGFFTKPLNFRVEVHMNTPARVAQWLCRERLCLSYHFTMSSYGHGLPVICLRR